MFFIIFMKSMKKYVLSEYDSQHYKFHKISKFFHIKIVEIIRINAQN
jgi:hypothetical protein